MKKSAFGKSITAIFTSIMLLACSQELPNEMFTETANEQEYINNLSQNRTYEEALAIAQDAIGMLGENCVTRSGRPRSISTDNVQYIVSTSSTRSSDVSDTLMYVFNCEDNAGFAVVAANRAFEGLIAVTEQGNYIVGEESENEGFNLYMDMATSYLLGFDDRLDIDTTTGGFDQLIDYKSKTFKDTITGGNQANVRWGGLWAPYTTYCPVGTSAGCEVVAIAQIMSIYKKPSSIKIDFGSNNYNLALDWNAIVSHKTVSTCGAMGTCPGDNQIGLLFRQLGEEIDISYSNTSGSYGHYIADAFIKLGYSIGNKMSYHSPTVLNSIKQGKSVFMCGEDDNKNIAHAWIIDGYKCVRTTRIESTRPSGSLLWTNDTIVSEQYYNHINWGWDGYCNGYFFVSVLEPFSPTFIDNGVEIKNTYDFDFDTDLYIYPYIY